MNLKTYQVSMEIAGKSSQSCTPALIFKILKPAILHPCGVLLL